LLIFLTPPERFNDEESFNNIKFNQEQVQDRTENWEGVELQENFVEATQRRCFKFGGGGRSSCWLNAFVTVGLRRPVLNHRSFE